MGFFRDFSSEKEHREWFLDECRKDWTKRTISYWLGDIAFTEDAIDDIAKLPGRKIISLGNHDELPTESYLRAFESVRGLIKYKSMWLSHAPIHRAELRRKCNLHGHTHYQNMWEVDGLEDQRYLNVCPENLIPLVGKPFISLVQVREYFKGVIL